jgi:hypothetical protein
LGVGSERVKLGGAFTVRVRARSVTWFPQAARTVRFRLPVGAFGATRTCRVSGTCWPLGTFRLRWTELGLSQETGCPPSKTLKETCPWKPFCEVKVRVRVTVSP